MYSPQLKKMINLLLQKDYDKRPKMKQIVKMNFFISLANQLGISLENPETENKSNPHNSMTKENNTHNSMTKENKTTHNKPKEVEVRDEDITIKEMPKHKSKSTVESVENLPKKIPNQQIKIASVEISFPNRKKNNIKKRTTGSSSSDKKYINERIVLLKNSNSDQKFNTNKLNPQNIENISIQISKKATNMNTKNSSLLKNSSIQSSSSQKNEKHEKYNSIGNLIREVKGANINQVAKMLVENKKMNDSNKVDTGKKGVQKNRSPYYTGIYSSKNNKEKANIKSYKKIVNAAINNYGFNQKNVNSKNIEDINQIATGKSKDNIKPKNSSNLTESHIINPTENKINLQPAILLNKEDKKEEEKINEIKPKEITNIKVTDINDTKEPKNFEEKKNVIYEKIEKEKKKNLNLNNVQKEEDKKLSPENNLLLKYAKNSKFKKFKSFYDTPTENKKSTTSLGGSFTLCLDTAQMMNNIHKINNISTLRSI